MQQKIEEIEKELLEVIVKHLEENKMELGTAQKLARDFLSMLPAQTQDELLNKLKTLGDTYAEAKEVYVEENGKELAQKEGDTLTQMRNAIQQGNIDHAITVAKQLHTQ